MGLDTTHGCWHGAYSSFNTFRNRLCLLTLKRRLDRFVGFGGSEPFPQKTKKPIVILLNHSDCDGEIEWQDCIPLKEALCDMRDELTLEKFAEVVALETSEDVVKKSPEALREAYNYFVIKVKDWIDGLEAAFQAKENVEFH